LFYPVSVQTIGVIIRKGFAHPPKQRVLWGRVSNDGFAKSKGKRLPTKISTTNDLERIMPILRKFLIDPTSPVKSVPEFVKAFPINYGDTNLDLVPEEYLDSRIPDADVLGHRLDQQIRTNIAALMDIDLNYPDPNRKSIIDSAPVRPTEVPIMPTLPKFREFTIEELFNVVSGDVHEVGALDPGSVILVSCGDTGNGVKGIFDLPSEIVYRDALTVAYNGSPLTTKLHPYEFATKDDVAVIIAKASVPIEVLIFIQAALNSEKWRFSYYRKCFKQKLMRQVIELPIDSKRNLNIDFIKAAVHSQPYWWYLQARLAEWETRKPIPAKSLTK
jgi:type I restriction enzyme M protein